MAKDSNNQEQFKNNQKIARTLLDELIKPKVKPYDKLKDRQSIQGVSKWKEEVNDYKGKLNDEK